MKRFAVAALAALLSSAALAQSPAPPPAPAAAPITFPVQVSSQDTANIRQICDFARTSAAVNLETAGALAQYCLALISRIANAEAEHKKAEAKPAEEPKK